ncbi:2-succinyl-5-enolpyruvyl-6-hydroxy-3-cyclohexene- 1-carboxylic-acid synthase [Arthrobacter ginkgonis]|uniref:2-succinyl-5-enolpyruvyl-6-hydroxy-3-cyclohexene-1-carboxylate synthase n=1 Tax=Arthrobacter ginkgonis TaxID=1630594 RepID=A0ABP7C2I5_9MICC
MTAAPSALTSLESARLAVAALAEGGVRHVIVCPGSRSAPLAYALAEAESRGAVTLHVRIDERDAGFTALGLALATGRPAAIVTTSGTAVGELLPAVMEANHAGVPLVVLSADRPEELRGTGANQTTDQTALFGTHVRHCADLQAGTDPVPELRRALLAAEGIVAADGHPGPGTAGMGGMGGVSVQVGPCGPVHVNLAFRDPLVPEPGDRLPSAGPDDAGRTGSADHPAPVDGSGPAEREGSRPLALPDLAERRTVVVAGHGAGPVAEAFARAHRLPLLAEPSSNARFGPHAVGPYRLLLNPFGDLIERVVVFGRPTLSRPVARLLDRADLPAALYVPEPVGWFTPGRRRERVVEELDDLSLFAGTGPAGWLEAWTRAGHAAAAAVDAAILDADRLNGPSAARAVWEAAAGNLLLGSSNAIRDADLAGVPAAAPAARVFANRGLAGIDGTLATATGIALGAGPGARTTALIGDVTFLHDAGGLLLGDGEPEPDLDIVVLNDAGGAIFSTLEHGGIAESGRYGRTVERLFGTPHRVRMNRLAAAYGVAHVRVDTPEDLRAALASRGRGRRIVEVAIDRTGVRELHRRIAAAVQEAVPASATRSASPAGPDPAAVPAAAAGQGAQRIHSGSQPGT